MSSPQRSRLSSSHQGGWSPVPSPRGRRRDAGIAEGTEGLSRHGETGITHLQPTSSSLRNGAGSGTGRGDRSPPGGQRDAPAPRSVPGRGTARPGSALPPPGGAVPPPTSRGPGEQRLGNFPPSSGKRGRLPWLPSQRQGAGRPASRPQHPPPSVPLGEREAEAGPLWCPQGGEGLQGLG